MKRLLSFLTILVCVTAAGKQPKITSRPFGELSTGESTKLYTITNRSGASMQLLDYGARIVSIMMPDRKGHNGDVVWSSDSETLKISRRKTDSSVLSSADSGTGSITPHSLWTVRGTNWSPMRNWEESRFNAMAAQWVSTDSSGMPRR